MKQERGQNNDPFFFCDRESGLKHVYQILCVVVICTLLSACGFNLREPLHFASPLRHMYLDTKDPYGQLARELKQQLKASQTEFVANKEAADVILQIEQDSTHQTLLSLNSTQQTRQYKLTVTIHFSLQNKHGVVILPTQILEDNRAITIQSNQILSSSNEIHLFNQQMRRALAYMILNRLASSEVANLIDQHISNLSKQLP